MPDHDPIPNREHGLLGFTRDVPTPTVLDLTSGAGYLGRSVVRRSGTRVAGRAFTVRTGTGDNLALHRALTLVSPGDVVVVTCPGPPVGLAGEIICTALQALGAAGLVTDSGVRDVDELATIGFPVWSRAVTPLGTKKTDPGSVGEPIDVAGVPVRTGDVILADGDGAVCVPLQLWPDIREGVEDKLETEAAWLTELARGRPLGELTGLVGRHPA